MEKFWNHSIEFLVCAGKNIVFHCAANCKLLCPIVSSQCQFEIREVSYGHSVLGEWDTVGTLINFRNFSMNCLLLRLELDINVCCEIR